MADPKVNPKTSNRKKEKPMPSNADSNLPPEVPNDPQAAGAGAPATPPTPSSLPARPEPPDPFDPSSLRLGSDYSEGLGVRKVITTIPNRKPNKTEWFRVRPGNEWRLQTAVLELEKGVERTTYLVAPDLWPDLFGEISPALLLTCVSRTGDLFMWRIKLPGPDGRANTWTESAIQIAMAAETNWCRMKADTTNGIYTHLESKNDLSEPKWPGLTFSEMLKIAFRDRMIDSANHPVLRDLRGDA